MKSRPLFAANSIDDGLNRRKVNFCPCPPIGSSRCIQGVSPSIKPLLIGLFSAASRNPADADYGQIETGGPDAHAYPWRRWNKS